MTFKINITLWTILSWTCAVLLNLWCLDWIGLIRVPNVLHLIEYFAGTAIVLTMLLAVALYHYREKGLHVRI